MNIFFSDDSRARQQRLAERRRAMRQGIDTALRIAGIVALAIVSFILGTWAA